VSPVGDHDGDLFDDIPPDDQLPTDDLTGDGGSARGALEGPYDGFASAVADGDEYAGGDVAADDADPDGTLEDRPLLDDAGLDDAGLDDAGLVDPSPVDAAGDETGGADDGVPDSPALGTDGRTIPWGGADETSLSDAAFTGDPDVNAAGPVPWGAETGDGFPPMLDFESRPEPSDGPPWSDVDALGAAPAGAAPPDNGAAVPISPPENAVRDLLAAAGVSAGPADVDAGWEAALSSADPAVRALAHWWSAGTA